MKHFKTFEMIEAVVRTGSIRKAAEDMNITASALNRRIHNFEEEFGWEIFERLPSGMRLNPAGEVLLQHIRTQISDMARVQSQVADLSGLRRGHVSIACSQALLPHFLPQQIANYRHYHPNVTFTITMREAQQAEEDLSTFNSDLALVFEPVHRIDFEILELVAQPLHAIFKSNHPLAATQHVRLRDCLEYPCILPSRGNGVQKLLFDAFKRIHQNPTPIIETESFELTRHYLLQEDAVGFEIPIALSTAKRTALASRMIDERDAPVGQLYLGQKKGRRLPVAASRFATQLSQALNATAAD